MNLEGLTKPEFTGEMLKALQRSWWGSLPEGCIPLRFSMSVSRLPHADAVEFYVCGYLEEHRREEQRHEGHTFAVQRRVNCLELYRSDLKVVLTSLMKDLEYEIPRYAAPFLYEMDPRIGTRRRVGSDQDLLPPSPLFDPPPGLILPNLHHAPWDRCTLCGQGFMRGQEVIWSGGNLLWLCNFCALEDHCNGLAIPF